MQNICEEVTPSLGESIKGIDTLMERTRALGIKSITTNQSRLDFSKRREYITDYALAVLLNNYHKPRHHYATFILHAGINTGVTFVMNKFLEILQESNLFSVNELYISGHMEEFSSKAIERAIVSTKFERFSFENKYKLVVIDNTHSKDQKAVKEIINNYNTLLYFHSSENLKQYKNKNTVIINFDEIENDLDFRISKNLNENIKKLPSTLEEFKEEAKQLKETNKYDKLGHAQNALARKYGFKEYRAIKAYFASGKNSLCG